MTEINLELHPKQSLAFKSRATEILYGGAAGGGKLVKKGDFVLTPFGFKAIEELKVGQLVNNPDGSIQRIIQLKPWVRLPKWIVEFSDGTKLEVAKDHLWQAWKGGKGRKINNVRTFGQLSAEVVETQELKCWLERGYKPQIPVCKEQHFNMVSRDKNRIPSYLLGLLLGDGCTTGSNMEIICHKKDVSHYLSRIGTSECNSKSFKTIRFTGEYNSYLKKKLQQYGLLGLKSDKKFIPKHYKMGSIESRYSIVQGLMDTDGYADPKDNGCYYYSVSKRLANDMAFILRSLGCVVTITSKIGSYKNDSGDIVKCKRCYCLYIKSRNKDKLFSLPRKKHNKPSIKISKAIVNIKTDGYIEGRCITVSNPNGLYITNDFIVTHNSRLMRTASIAWCTEIPKLQVYLFRRLSDDLAKNHLEGIGGYYSMLAPWMDAGYVKIRHNPTTITFWNGAKIHLSHCQYEKDRLKYQGAEINALLIDELTHFSDVIYRFLRGRCRLGTLQLPDKYKGQFPKIICGSNPGGVGHTWVKSAFVDNAPPLNIVKMPPEEGGMLRQYIPALLSDNPSQDPEYENMLKGLGNPELVKAMLEGSWDIDIGSIFGDIWNRKYHVIEPFVIPKTWRIDRCFDWGSSKPFAVLWVAESDGTEATLKDGSKLHTVKGDLFVAAEWYGWNGNANEGCKMLATAIAQGIKEKEAAIFSGYHVKAGPADSAIFATENGVNISEDMARIGIRWERADKSPGSRKNGWERMRTYLSNSLPKDGSPRENAGLFLFNTCTHSIRTLPALPRDERNPDDVNTNAEDHIADALRYRVAQKRSEFKKLQLLGI